MNLPTLAEVEALRKGPLPKGVTRKRLKGRKDRKETKVKKSVREQCVEREGGICRYPVEVAPNNTYDIWRQVAAECSGPLEWAHAHAKRRSQTRNQAPEIRHTTADSFMLCKFHHDCYDGRQKPRLFITALTRKGADGPLKFRRRIG